MFNVNAYQTSYVKISNRRLSEILKSGDIIRGWNSGIPMSSHDTRYTVTHVDHWGVYAYPTEELIKRIRKWNSEDSEENKVKHYKFKWCNISAIEMF